jgi:hypothetical protein
MTNWVCTHADSKRNGFVNMIKLIRDKGLAALMLAGLLALSGSALAQTWQVQGKKTPIAVEGTACNTATDKLGITVAPETLLICKAGVWVKQSAVAVVTPLYLRNTGAQPAACPAGWSQADLGYVFESGSAGNYVRTCLPPSTQACSVLYLKNNGAAPASCPAAWSQADIASVLEGSSANNIRSCITCAAQAECSGGSCTVPTGSSCAAPWGGVIANGASLTAYAGATVPYGSACAAETRTCNNGVLSGSNTVQACTVSAAPLSCNLPWGGTLASGGAVTAYAAASVSYGNSCTAETRSCTNGVLSGSYSSASCSVSQTPIYGWVYDYNQPIYGWRNGDPIYGWVDDVSSPIWDWVNGAPIYSQREITTGGDPIYGDPVTTRVSANPHGKVGMVGEAYSPPPPCSNDTPGGVLENEVVEWVTDPYLISIGYGYFQRWDCAVYAVTRPVIGTTPIVVTIENYISGYTPEYRVVGYNQKWDVTGYNQVWGVTGYQQVWGIVGYQ